MKSAKLYPYVLLCTLFLAAGAVASDVPETGSPAPDFNLVSQDGTKVSLGAYKGSWIVLFFFGDHSTADVDLYARNLARDAALYSSSHAAVIGIGRTSSDSDHTWAKKVGVSFPLLSDPDQKIAGAYGVPAGGSNGLSDGGIYQVIIAPDGLVRLSGIVTNDVDDASMHALASLKYLQEKAKGDR